MHAHKHVWAVAAVLVIFAVVAAACSSDGGDEAGPTTGASDDTTTTEPSTADTAEEVAVPDTVVEGEDGEVDLSELDTRVEGAEGYAEILGLTIDDIQLYWGDELPTIYGIDYLSIEPDHFFPYDAGTPPPGCPDELPYEVMAGNAFYCSIGDFVAWDQGTLFPQLYEEFGPYAIAMVLAHEWGHAIQDQTGTDGPTIMLEQQADCFAGAWTAAIAAGDSELLTLDPGDLELALGGMLKFRDEPGTAVDDPSAHGSGFDRIAAFQEGFSQGPERCADYPNDPPILAPLEFTEPDDFESGGNLPLADTIDVATNDLNDYWLTLVGDTFIPVDSLVPYTMDGELPTCGGTPVDTETAEFNIFFCIDDNYVGWDEELLATVHGEIGDFGVAALLSAQWSTSAQIQAGLTEETHETALQRDCLAGAWTGNVYNYTIGGAELAGREPFFTLSPGDLDEVIQAFIAFSVPAGSEEAELYGTAFERVAAFREGFLDGANPCFAYTE